MAASLPPDPYAALGVAKDAGTAEIRSAYRKLVLKCHPDKIKDESLRGKAQDEFQKVQEAYELLSDEVKRARYDQKARLVELRKEAMEKGGPVPSFGHRTTGSYDIRNGKVYEERVPQFFEDDPAYAEELWASSKKYEGPEKRSTTKDAEEKKKKSKHPESKREPPKERTRDGQSRERRREFSDKYSRTADYDSDSDASCSYRYDFPEPKVKRESHSKSPGPDTSPRGYPDPWESSKHDYLQDTARQYIERSRNNLAPEPERRPSASSWPFQMHHEPVHVDTPRRSSARPRPRERRPSIEIIDPSSLRSHAARKIPNLTSATSAPPTIKIPSAIRISPAPPTRSSTYHAREKRDHPPIRRADTLPSIIPRQADPIMPKSSKLKDLYDSGYSSSSPATPKIFQSSPPKSSKYMVVEENDDYTRHRAVLIDPTVPTHRRSHSTSPALRDPIPIIRPPPKQSSRSKSRDFHSRRESGRGIPTLRTSRDGLLSELSDDYYPRIPEEPVRYAPPRIRQEDVSWGHSRDPFPRSHKPDARPSIIRKESSCAY
ncbi:predicted protein [Uncinocarpus reesii 1704]|uniref:J domain-containing protein n=1 Tax=Uncinocarpus reesii (strain UAMH 1704) TaxID=336963 RepID=C4JKC5_UNCRE|nr:uncharacterized protein UREG_02082 [Uncinocarpus reesii 1704]EEP77233.1 predicted protein [Uncinocarpus reesii 1704]